MKAEQLFTHKEEWVRKFAMFVQKYQEYSISEIKEYAGVYVLFQKCSNLKKKNAPPHFKEKHRCGLIYFDYSNNEIVLIYDGHASCSFKTIEKACQTLQKFK